MRTDNDVRQALREREREAASAEDVLPRLQITEHTQRHNARRTYYLAAAACAAVVAVVVATMLVADRRHDEAATTPSAKATSSVVMPLGPKFEFNFSLPELPPGYEIMQQVIDPDFQWAEIARTLPPGCDYFLPAATASAGSPKKSSIPSPKKCIATHGSFLSLADVLVFGQGQFDPSLMKNASPVTINGMPGLAADIVPINDTVKWTIATLMDPTKPPKLTTIAWQYAPGSWAVVAWHNNTDDGARQSAIHLAAATRTGEAHPALVPFEVDYLPTVVDRRWELTFHGPGSSEVDFGNPSSHFVPGLHLGTPDGALPISVGSTPLNDPQRIPQKGDVALDVGGRPARYSPKLSALFVSCGAKCTLTVGYGELGAHLAGSIGEADLVKIAEHITVARSLTDTATWFDAATALPH